MQFLSLGVLASGLEACADLVSPPPPPTELPTPTAPAEATALVYMRAWEAGDYAGMYQMLTPSAQGTITQEAFVKRYRDILSEATVTRVLPALVSVLEEGNTAQAHFKATFETVVLGTFTDDNRLTLRRESDRWGVVWSASAIFAGLGPNQGVRLVPIRSTRGNIYDRQGNAIAVGESLVSVYLWPAEMRRNGNEDKVLAALSPILNLTIAKIREKYIDLNAEWKTFIADITAERAQANAVTLQMPGIALDTRESRGYPGVFRAAHLAGYTGKITAEELKTLYARGYREDDMVGRAGLEALAEPYIGGKRGGQLLAINTDGTPVATLREQSAQQSFSVFSTIDLGVQEIAENALGNRIGSVVVMEAKTGNVLAMVSRPTYDPNVFVDRLRDKEAQNLLSNPAKPLLNRAVLGAYPPGSVYKVVTIACAFERGGMGQWTPFNDPGYYDGVPGFRKYCWLWAYGRGHGIIGLALALTASCDVTFYQVGAALNRIDPNLMPSFGYAFGFGSPTGIGLAEAEGNVSDPKKQSWVPNDPVDMAIGQDTMLVTPIQMADMMAAVANGGTLFRPRLLGSVSDILSGARQTFSSETRGSLPVSSANLAVIRQALRGVTTDLKNGTAAYVFEGDPVISAGKTGTAQTPGATSDPHAWFAGYAPADNPEIVVVVIVEHGGEGSKVAAPIFRKIIDGYFKVDLTPTPRPNTTPGAKTVTPLPAARPSATPVRKR